jgi:predicted nucleic acid-binding protein
MTVESFLDTNVIVYAAAGHGAEEAKRQRALKLIDDEDFATSAQVLQEFYVTVTRKVATRLPPTVALEWIEQLEAFPCLEIDATIVKLGAEISERYGISYWDGAIVAAAEGVGAKTLFSEDLNHGQFYGAVRVVNPFR